MGKLRIHRRAHPRRGYARRSGTHVAATHVRATEFDITDRGAPGRGPKLITIKKPGALKELGYSASDSASQRRAALRKAVLRYGERSVQGMLQAQATFRKRTDGLRGVFQSDRTFVAKNYGTYRGKPVRRSKKKQSFTRQELTAMTYAKSPEDREFEEREAKRRKEEGGRLFWIGGKPRK